MEKQRFCLRWDGFHSSVTALFDSLRHQEELVDVTLSCEEGSVAAHRIMLSVCSPYFRQLFKTNTCQHIVVFLKDTSVENLRLIVEFMYRGSVNVAQSQLAGFIKTAEMLQIRGLSGDEEKMAVASPMRSDSASEYSPVAKRPRHSPVTPARRGAASTVPRNPPPPPSKEEPLDGSGDASDDASLDGLAFTTFSHPEPAFSGPTSTVFTGPVAPTESVSAPVIYTCETCGATFKNHGSLRNHSKFHLGQTHCRLCGGVYASIPTLRRHLVGVHGLSTAEVYQEVPNSAHGGRLPPSWTRTRVQTAGTLGLDQFRPEMASGENQSAAAGAEVKSEVVRDEAWGAGWSGGNCAMADAVVSGDECRDVVIVDEEASGEASRRDWNSDTQLTGEMTH